jgi:hypothetical protein
MRNHLVFSFTLSKSRRLDLVTIEVCTPLLRLAPDPPVFSHGWTTGQLSQWPLAWLAGEGKIAYFDT